MFRNVLVIVILLIVVLVATVAPVTYRTSVPEPDTELIGMFGGVSLRIELATTTIAIERGLGGRKNVPDGYGMLFVFNKADRYGFWMKDMLVPIDIFWLDENKSVVSFISNVATSTYPNVLYPSAPAFYVLETRAGFAGLHTIATGTPLLLQNFADVLK